MDQKGGAMNVIVQSKTMVITAAIESAAYHFAKKFTRRGQRISQVHVFLEQVAKKKNDTTAAIATFAVDVPGKNVVVREKARDVYLALSEAANGVLRQLSKTKEKRLARRLKYATA